MIRLLYGDSYLSVSPLLGYFGVFIAFYSMLSALSNFLLSIGKTKIWVFLVLGAATQALLISLFHQSLLQVIQVSIVINAVLFLILFLYNKKIIDGS